jgi:putative transposase
VLIKSAKQLCTYIGKPMDTDAKQLAYKVTRKQIREDGFSPLLVEWDDFVSRINAAIERYNNTPHRGLPAMRDPLTQKRVNMTPNQAWEYGLQRMQQELSESEWLHPANELPDLYHPAVERTVVRGEIQFGTLTTGQPKRYYSADLEEWNGQRVQVAYSPSDASKVWVRDLEHGRLLAVATLGGNSSAYFAESVVELARIKRGKGRLKRLENHAEEVRLEMQGPGQVVIEHPAEVKEVCLRVVKQIEEAQVVEEQFSMPEDPQEALRCWQDLDTRRKAGETLPEDQERAWKSWQNNSVWKAWNTLQKMMEPQPEPALRAVK